MAANLQHCDANFSFTVPRSSYLPHHLYSISHVSPLKYSFYSLLLSSFHSSRPFGVFLEEFVGVIGEFDWREDAHFREDSGDETAFCEIKVVVQVRHTLELARVARAFSRGI